MSLDPILGNPTFAPPGQASPMASSAQASLAQLIKLLQARSQNQQQPSPSPIVSPGRVGSTNPLKVGFNAQGAGGTMGAPQTGPTYEYHGNPLASQVMDTLTPKSKDLYAAFTGVSQALGEYRERKEKKEQAEAANIAQNLMIAIESGDIKTQQDILNDKHSSKVLDKVYKGWLTKAKESQQPQDKPDPAVQGFEQGLRQHVNQKGQKKQQPQAQGPGIVGGYRLPQASPIQQLQTAKVNAELQAAKQDPSRLLETQLTSNEQRQAELAAAKLQVSPADLEMMNQAQRLENIKQIGAYARQVAKDNEDYQKALVANQGRLDATNIAALARVQSSKLMADARVKAAMLGYGLKGPTMQVSTQVNSAKQASQLIQGILDGTVKMPMMPGGLGNIKPSGPYVELSQYLIKAGLGDFAKNLPTLGDRKKLADMKTAVDKYADEYISRIKIQYPNWKGGASLTPDQGGEEGGGGEDELDKAIKDIFNEEKPAATPKDDEE